MAETTALPATLKATLVAFALGPVPTLGELARRAPKVEGVEWSQSWIEERVMLVRVPLLLPGSRLKALLRGALDGPAIAREVREFRVIMEAAREALREQQAKPGDSTLLALADALDPLPPSITMFEVQRRLREALSGTDAEIASLSHYDSLILAPSDLEVSWIQAAIEGAYASLAPAPLAVILRNLEGLEGLLPRLPLR